MLHVASFGVVEVTALLAVPGGIVFAWAAARKLGPEKDALYITSAQGAAVIMDSLVSTLRVEIDRGRADLAAAEAENERLVRENERLKAELVGIRRRHGGRRDDRPDA